MAFAIAMSAVSLYYYLKLIKQMYVLPASDPQRLPMCKATCAVLGVVCLLVFLLGMFPARAVGALKHLSDRVEGDPVWVAPPASVPVVSPVPESAAGEPSKSVEVPATVAPDSDGLLFPPINDRSQIV